MDGLGGDAPHRSTGSSLAQYARCGRGPHAFPARRCALCLLLPLQVSLERYIDIPQEILDVYKLWR